MKKIVALFLSLGLLFSLSFSVLAMEYKEAPMLKEKVDAEELPPVEERLPENPIVIEPNEEIGTYGGTLVRGRGLRNHESTLRMNRPATETIPNIAQDWEFSEDGKVFTLYLRKGIKWSDGHPLTAEDFLFNYNHILLNKDLTTTLPYYMNIGDGKIKMEKVDDYTIRFKFPKPYYGILHRMNMVGGKNNFKAFPAHFLKKYHIEFNENADELAQEEGFDHWYQYFSLIANTDNDTQNFAGNKLGKPELDPWVFKKETPTTIVYERNPYYFKVDSEGNQLPYIDYHYSKFLDDAEVRLMKMLNGELDFCAWGTYIEDFPVLKKNEEEGNFQAWLTGGLAGSTAAFCLNQTFEGDPVLAELLRDKKFRQALSLAIDRNEINDLVALDQGTPRQATLHPDTVGYKEDWAQTFADYDPERANKLLDEIGLDEKNSEGYRLGSDGEPVEFNLLVREGAAWIPTTELVRDYWRDVGIFTTMKPLDNKNLISKVTGNQSPVFVWVMDRLHGPAFISSRGSWFNPSFWFGPIGPDWNNWFSSDGEEGVEPPALIKSMKEKADQLPFVPPEKQKEYIEFLGQSYADNLWIIGTVGMVGQPAIAKNELGNVRKDFKTGISIGKNIWLEQFYWKK